MGEGDLRRSTVGHQAGTTAGGDRFECLVLAARRRCTHIGDGGVWAIGRGSAQRVSVGGRQCPAGAVHARSDVGESGNVVVVHAPHGALDRQGQAAGERDHCIHQRLISGVDAGHAEQLFHVSTAEVGERPLVGIAGEVVELGASSLVDIGRRSSGHHHQQVGPRPSAGEEAGEHQGGVVAEMEVVDHDHQRPLCADELEQGGELLEPVTDGDVVRAGSAPELVQHLSPRPHGGAVVPAANPDRRRGRPGECFADQSRLAHPCWSAHQLHDAARRSADVLGSTPEGRQLGGPPDERQRRLGIHGGSVGADPDTCRGRCATA